MKPLVNYFQASRSELAKVAWPNRSQTARLTLVVIVFSLAFAAVLGRHRLRILDYSSKSNLKRVIYGRNYQDQPLVRNPHLLRV